MVDRLRREGQTVVPDKTAQQLYFVAFFDAKPQLIPLKLIFAVLALGLILHVDRRLK